MERLLVVSGSMPIMARTFEQNGPKRSSLMSRSPTQRANRLSRSKPASIPSSSSGGLASSVQPDKGSDAA